MSKIQSNKSRRRTIRKHNKRNPFAQKVREAIHYTRNAEGKIVIQGKKRSDSIFSNWA